MDNHFLSSVLMLMESSVRNQSPRQLIQFHNCSKCFINFALKLLAAVIGAIIYYVVITLVLRLGLESTDLKLLTALVVAVFLSVPYFTGKRAAKARK